MTQDTSHTRCHRSNTYSIHDMSFKGSLSLSTDVDGVDRVSLFFRRVDVVLFKNVSSCFSFKLFPISMWTISWQEVCNEK